MKHHTTVRAPLALALLTCVLVSSPASAAIEAVSTFESIGLSWRALGGSSSAVASVRYKATTGGDWSTGYPLWFDERDAEYRGSLVMLTPGTTYEIALTLPSGFEETTRVRTWSETFPVAETIALPERSSATFEITRSGTSSGYILYTFGDAGSATIDVDNRMDADIRVNASYVIIRGLTLRGAARHGIVLQDASHDVVIEDCDISGYGKVESDGFGENYNAAIYGHSRDIERIIVQRNYLHHPRTDSNNWSEYRTELKYHPDGPQAITLFDSKGNHVFRYNTVASDANHFFNDCFGAGENFSELGFPNRDSDIYGNRISQCWDEGIESEGANRNVRIWGNFIEETYVKIATATTSVGPLYVFRNVGGTSRKDDLGSWTTATPGGFLKTSDTNGGGRIFVFHNTILQPGPLAGGTNTRGSSPGLGHGGDTLNLFSRNNILHVVRDGHASIARSENGTSSFDYDLYNGRIEVPAGHERNGIHSAPVYASSNGAGEFALAVGSGGFDAGQVLPGFNDGFAGKAPDIGAFESGSAPMEFGVDAYIPGQPLEDDIGGLAQINSGGDTVEGFLADTNFKGGTARLSWDGDTDVSHSSLAGPSAIYRTVRYGSRFSYVIPGLEPGKAYGVRLHFAEHHVTKSGQRRFDVSINGKRALESFDVFAAAKAQHRAVVRSFSFAAPASGQLTLDFAAVTNAAMIYAIEIVAPSSTLVGPDEVVGDDPSLDESWPTVSSGCDARGDTSSLDVVVLVGGVMSYAYSRRRRVERSCDAPPRR